MAKTKTKTSVKKLKPAPKMTKPTPKMAKPIKKSISQSSSPKKSHSHLLTAFLLFILLVGIIVVIVYLYNMYYTPYVPVPATATTNQTIKYHRSMQQPRAMIPHHHHKQKQVMMDNNQLRNQVGYAAAGAGNFVDGDGANRFNMQQLSSAANDAGGAAALGGDSGARVMMRPNMSYFHSKQTPNETPTEAMNSADSTAYDN
jgi:hypothetical protein